MYFYMESGGAQQMTNYLFGVALLSLYLIGAEIPILIAILLAIAITALPYVWAEHQKERDIKRREENERHY